MPWRQPEANGRFDPYKIMVSEVMLQQTQVSRVGPKFETFMQQFPTVQALSSATLADVLEQWNGLGYNRRAKFLHQAAQKITTDYQGQFPQTLNMLTKLPGIGVNTAAAILAYAYNQPVPFLETNIRTVYIHHFFADYPELVSDKQLLPLVTETMDQEHPREWYWALMDYGAHLKATVGNLSRQSQHYTKQSRFEGSRRQLRAQVLRAVLAQPCTSQQLADNFKDKRLTEVLTALEAEGFITKRNGRYQLLG